eukprot:748800-Hanusia_phi.AAC.2
MGYTVPYRFWGETRIPTIHNSPRQVFDLPAMSSDQSKDSHHYVVVDGLVVANRGLRIPPKKQPASSNRIRLGSARPIEEYKPKASVPDRIDLSMEVDDRCGVSGSDQLVGAAAAASREADPWQVLRQRSRWGLRVPLQAAGGEDRRHSGRHLEVDGAIKALQVWSQARWETGSKSCWDRARGPV